MRIHEKRGASRCRCRGCSIGVNCCWSETRSLHMHPCPFACTILSRTQLLVLQSSDQTPQFAVVPLCLSALSCSPVESQLFAFRKVPDGVRLYQSSGACSPHDAVTITGQQAHRQTTNTSPYPFLSHYLLGIFHTSKL